MFGQTYVQIDISKIILIPDSHRPTRKCVKRKDDCVNIFIVEGGMCKAVLEEWQD